MRDRELFEAEISQLLPAAVADESQSEIVPELVVRGSTHYLPLALSPSVKRVGAFVPPAAASAGTVDVIVYFHGHAISLCGTKTDKFRAHGMQYYWNTPLFRCLRRDLASSGRCAVLLAPAMHPFVGRDLGAAGYGNLHKDGKFDELVNRALTLLKDRGALGQGTAVGNIVLAGHSGGGQPLQMILRAKNTLKPRIRAAWGFESLYFGTAILDAWLKSDPAVRFRHFRRKGWKQARIDVLAKNANFTDTATASSHCKAVDEFWGKAIALMPTAPATQQDYEVQYERPDSSTGSGGFVLERATLLGTPVKIVRTGNESAWKAYAKALARDPDTKKAKPKFVEVQQAPSVSLKAIVRNAQALARKAGHADIAARLDPERWFLQFTQTTFLGRPCKPGQYLHVELAKLLKTIETDLIRTVGKPAAKAAGDVLLNGSTEGISGSRKQSSTAALSMHMFGLAVDVNYLGNPYIESQSDMQVLAAVLRRASALLRKRAVIYAKEVTKNKKTVYERAALDYDAIAEVDNLIEEYFALLDAPTSLRARLAAAASSEHWKNQSEADARARIQKDLDALSTVLSRGPEKKGKKVSYARQSHFKTHGILDFDKRFVEGMVRGGMHWGASYGDMMHFDMRRTGVGLYIEKARIAYLVQARRQMAQHLASKDYGYHALVE